MVISTVHIDDFLSKSIHKNWSHKVEMAMLMWNPKQFAHEDFARQNFHKSNVMVG